jgi:hypothetical protein
MSRFFGQVEVFGNRFLHIVDEKAIGTAGGTFTAGQRLRDLNTVRTNEIPGASLAGNVVTLPAGEYYCEASAPANLVESAKLLLVDNPPTITILNGLSEKATNSGGVHMNCRLSGRFTLAAAGGVTLNHFAATTKLTDGFGVAVSHATALEVYAELKIWKLN